MRVNHDDGVEMTFDNIVNDSSLYASDVLNRIKSKKLTRFGKSNRIGIFFFSESECSTCVDSILLLDADVRRRRSPSTP